MDQPSAIPRLSGIPRPAASRLPVLRSSGSQSQLRQPSSTEQLRKKPSVSSLARPSQQPPLQKKTSRVSLVPSYTPSAPAPAAPNSKRASVAPTNRRVSGIPSFGSRASTASTASTTSNDALFKRPFARPPSRQASKVPPQPAPSTVVKEDDALGSLDGFRSASRASSRAGSRAGFNDNDDEPDRVLENESDAEPKAGTKKKSRPSLSERTIESLATVPSSPGPGKGRRRSSFFNADNSMPPPLRPASAMSSNGGSRPTTSDGAVQPIPATPKRFGMPSARLSMTAPGKRSISANVTTSVATPSRTPSIARSVSTIKKQPLSLAQNLQDTSETRPLVKSKSIIARTPKARQSVFGVFGQAVSPPGNASAAPVTPSNGRTPLKKTPVTVRHVSSSSALREQMAKARTARQSDIVEDAEQSPKIGGSSNALREQIAKAKEAARRAKTETVRTSTPPRDPILPDPNEIATFDFGLDDPFNQVAKGSKSVLRKRIDGGRVDGRLNIAAMSLTEIPEAVLQMYKYDANDTTVAWGEIVDLTSIIAADNELELLPDAMFPDVDPEAMEDSDEGGPQFGAVQNMDLHGNVLRELPLGLKRLTQLSRLNLVSKNLSQALVMRLDRRTQSRSLLALLANLMQSRNKLPVDVLDIISEIASLRELKLAENDLQGALPVTIAKLTSLEVLELQGNKLTSLPIEIGKLTCLRLMNVSNNQLLNIPMELFETSLLELVANKNRFEDAFFSIEFVPNLQELNISNNSLKRLCEGETLNLPALKSLNLSTNRLTSLPSVESWVNLQTLVAGENKVMAFPEGFTSLPNLRTADFTANDITQIDEKIALMPLEHLTLAANPLRERKFLTMSFDDMKRALASRVAPEDAPAAEEIGGEGLIEGTVPGTQGWQVTPSGTLDLSAKSLTELDESALSVVADDIRQLYLQQNAFESIPMALSQITFLTVLDLSKNHIATILTSPLFLPRLKELRLNGNKLASLDHLTTRLAAPSLQTLDISNNRLTGTLPALRSSYPALISLIACDNTISEVPAESLSGLKIVNLSNNDIERLEPQIGHLAGTLTSLNVEGNKFRVPNYQLLQKGTDAVLAYLRDRIPRESWVSEKSDATVFFDADDGAEV